MKHTNDYTLEEYQAMKNFGERSIFDSVIIVPMEELHDSGFRCMKFILLEKGEIVGVVGGWCDVVHPNGIGNYGRSLKRPNGKLEPIPAYISMDCLANSGCVRLMLGDYYECDDFIGSDFCFYKVDEE